MINIAEFEKKLTYLLANLARLDGRRQELVARNAHLESTVALAKGRQNVAGEVEEFLTAYQNRVHSKAVADIQSLLTYAAVDVLQTTKSVRLELETSRGAPALNFFMDNDGNLEDILDGQGGALTNAVVTGLRFLSLIRTQNRRLISLDESDCWIKPERIKGYAKFLSEVSSLMQVQTLFVSHHAVDLVEDYATVHRLQRDGVGGCEVVLDNVPATDWENESQPGLRQIWLVDFMSHTDTKIDLYPGVNVLTGDNDKGKSTIFNTALRAFAYNQGSDAHIAHGAEEAHVVLTLEDNIQVSYVRRRKGSPKAIYRMWKDGVLTHEGPPVGGLPPSWICDILNMPMVNDMEVHMGSQKSPIFLLDESPSARAQILSLGKESSKLLQLMDAHKKQKAQDAQTVNTGESEISVNLARLEKLSWVSEIQDEVKPIVDGLVGLKQDIKVEQDLSKLSQGIAETHQTLESAQKVAAALKELPGVPELTDTRPLGQLIPALQRAKTLSALPKPERLPELPTLIDVQPLVQMGSRLVALQNKAKIAKPEPLPAIPQLQDTQALSNLLAQIDAQLIAMPKQSQDLQSLRKEKDTVEQEIHALLEETGHSCPLCGQAVVDASEITHEH